MQSTRSPGLIKVLGVVVGLDDVREARKRIAPLGTSTRHPGKGAEDGWDWWLLEDGDTVVMLFWSQAPNSTAKIVDAIEFSPPPEGDKFRKGSTKGNVPAPELGVLATARVGQSFELAVDSLQSLGVDPVFEGTEAEFAWTVDSLHSDPPITYRLTLSQSQGLISKLAISCY